MSAITRDVGDSGDLAALLARPGSYQGLRNNHFFVSS